MKRNTVLGLLVFCNKEFTIVGTIKEIKLYDKEMKIKYFIINDKTLDKSFILPFDQSTFIDAVIHCSRESLIEIDNMEFYKEIRQCKEVFSYKNVFDENEEFIGKISDYSFNEITGELEDIYYYNYDTEQTSIIKDKAILNKTINGILNKISTSNNDKKLLENFSLKENEKLNEKELAQTFEVQENKNLIENDKIQESESKDILNNVEIEEIQQKFLLQDIENIKLFTNNIEEEHESLKNLYLNLQKEIKEEFDSIMLQIENKIDLLFNTELKEKEEEFIKKITKIYEKQREEMVDKIILMSDKVKKINNFKENEQSIEVSNIEKNPSIENNFFENTTVSTPDQIKEEEIENKPTDYYRRIEDKDVLLEQNDKASNIYKINDIKKQNEDETNSPKVNINDTYVEKENIQTNTVESDNIIEKPITESVHNIDIINEEKNEKLEKLYQLQAKRISIIDKMLKTKEY